MQVVGHFQVTNIANGHILISGVKLRKPNVRGQVLVENFQTGTFGTHAIPRGRVAEVMFDLWIEPPVKNAGEVFTADVCIFDQFGNEHWSRKIEFIYS